MSTLMNCAVAAEVPIGAERQNRSLVPPEDLLRRLVIFSGPGMPDCHCVFHQARCVFVIACRKFLLHTSLKCLNKWFNCCLSMWVGARSWYQECSV